MTLALGFSLCQRSFANCCMSRTAILCLPRIDCLGVFHNIASRFYPILQPRFQRAISSRRCGRSGQRLFSHPNVPTQGRLHCTQHKILSTAMQVLSCFVRSPGRNTLRLSHKSRSPRKSGRSVYAVTPRPKALTPSTHPNLGEKSKHQGLHRYAL